MSTQNIPDWHPEYIDAGNLDGMSPLPYKVPAQRETRSDLRALAKAMDIKPWEAARYAIEVGIVALYRAGVIPDPNDADGVSG